MVFWDYLVLTGYFLLMAGIGFWTMWKIKRQEDYFMGGRGFGKILQTFAAFGAGTGSGDPVAVAQKTFVNGMSGIWSIMAWLFCTPFYWITSVWFRRMRHVTTGDWFVERYESKGLGAAYTVLGLLFYILYSAFLFKAVGEFATPLIGETLFGLPTLVVIIPIIGATVILYGALGGLIAAYWTDLIQGICIILLSVLLIPFGLWALVQEFGDPATQSMLDGFAIMHERLPESMFTITGSTAGSEFTVGSIAALAVMMLVGIVVQPHMIATGGGSAKREIDARVGMVTGNLFKRICTVGWTLTALIILALMAGSPELQEHPEQAWGFASMRLFAATPGLTGLMFACLLAALMSSVSCYMVVGSGLVVRNIYAAYIKPNASEAECLWTARMTGCVIVSGAVLVAILGGNVYDLFKSALIILTMYAPLFWIGMFWRRATKTAAWATFLLTAVVFFVLPWLLPMIQPQLRDNQQLTAYPAGVAIETTRDATASDVAQREAAIEIWAAQEEKQGDQPETLTLDKSFTVKSPTKSMGVFWTGGVKPIDEQGQPVDTAMVETDRTENPDAGVNELFYRYPEDTRLAGAGSLRTELIPYSWVGMELDQYSASKLNILSMVMKTFAPFVVMILLSLVTPRTSKEALDRYYVKMKTPVGATPEDDAAELERSYADPARFDSKKLLPGTGIEIQKPTMVDAVGFTLTVAACFGVIALAWLVAELPRIIAG